eukprot:TRINITY_DN2467_c3_g1_i2.p1 TRINITY_DN2467_c3_g1~~TRINITY_DN2467_c3_g1_i2.p1  ORF type:complete len:362 (-),score=99.73 TRINITY_DN2467_c3_g1_i2:71-1156(-)
MEVVMPVKTHLENDKRDIANFERKAKADQKSAAACVKKAEIATKKAGKSKGADLSKSLQDLNQKVQEGQKILLDQLKAALTLERGRYCSVIGGWTKVFAATSFAHDATVKLITECNPTLIELAGSQARVPDDKKDLIKQQQRTLIAVSEISKEWREVFQSAGVKKSDLRDEETAKFILETLEEMLPAGTDAKEALSKALASANAGPSAEEEETQQEEEPDDEGEAAPPPPPSPPAERAGAPPPPPPRNSPALPEATRGEPPRGCRPNPPPPPPVRPKSVTASAPPVPTREPRMPVAAVPSAGLGALAGMKPRDRVSVALPDVSSLGAGLSSKLASAMATRRGKVEVEEEEEEDDWNEEWSD